MKNNKIVRYIKKHSSAAVGIGVFILVIIALLLFKDVFMFDEFKAIYGTRLDGIDKVKITAKQKNDAENLIKGNVKEVKIRVSGRIVNAIIDTNKDTSIEDAKSLSGKVLEAFTDNQKKYYDFQFLVKNDENTTQYPIIGYRHHTKDSISWTKDRTGN